jgi:hypothetical protein
VRVRQPVHDGVRHGHDGAEPGALQRRRVVRPVLPDRVRLPDGWAVVPPGRRSRDGHRHQPLPAQLRAPQQQRRLVQPAAGALRHGAAGLGQDRRLPGRHHPRAVPARGLRPAGRRALHHHGVQLLRARAHLQRRRQRLRRQRLGPGHVHQPGAHEQELGRELAVARRDRRTGAHLRRHHHGRTVHRLPERRARQLGVRHVLHEQPAVLLLIILTLPALRA